MDRHIFTTEELTRHNFGLYIIRSYEGKIEDNPGYAATVSFKLGYIHSKSGKYGRINFLTDGWFCPLADTVEELCEILNKDEKGFRLMTKEEVIYLITVRNQGFI